MATPPPPMLLAGFNGKEWPTFFGISRTLFFEIFFIFYLHPGAVKWKVQSFCYQISVIQNAAVICGRCCCKLLTVHIDKYTCAHIYIHLCQCVLAHRVYQLIAFSLLMFIYYLLAGRSMKWKIDGGVVIMANSAHPATYCKYCLAVGTMFMYIYDF